MAEPRTNELMEKIVSLCKRRGFIYQSSEIYGGINGFWDYGPLGAELKRNVKDLWWTTMTRLRDDVVGLEATIIMAPEIWKASGHVETFADLMVECPLTKKRFRADQIEPQQGTAYWYSGATMVGAEGSDAKRAIEQYVKEFKPSKVEDIDRNKLEGLLIDNQQQRLGEKFVASRSLDAAKDTVKALLKSLRLDQFAVLLPAGKPPESARSIAAKYYQQWGMELPTLLCERTEKVENTQRFNPENGALLTEPRPFNLMFKTYVGPIESEENVAYLRPETAQAIFAQFKNVLETSRQKVPFGIAQIGKAFRNEVTPRNFTFRSREFEQMELEYFIKPDEVIEAIAGSVAKPGEGHPGEPQPSWGWEAWHKYWVEERIRFYEGIGLPRSTLVEYWQKPEELAHYARATVDILFKFPFSKRDEQGELTGEELEGIAARSDFDLSQHERFSGKSMGVFDEELRAAWAKLDDAKKQELSNRYYEARLKYLTKTAETTEKAEKKARQDADGLAKGQYIPHVIEPSAGVDRLILALICNAYYEDQMPDEKGKMETRVVLKFHPRVAPVKVGVMPLLKNKPDLVKNAIEVRELLRPHMNVFYDDGGAIGRRYRRQDEAGTPFCVTIDFETLEGMKEGPFAGQKDTVTLRYRDDGRQERVKIDALLPLLLEKIR
jgi:glycyl-tRNA synthetase